jgi:hypothetical protein
VALSGRVGRDVVHRSVGHDSIVAKMLRTNSSPVKSLARPLERSTHVLREDA